MKDATLMKDIFLKIQAVCDMVSHVPGQEACCQSVLTIKNWLQTVSIKISIASLIIEKSSQSNPKQKQS